MLLEKSGTYRLESDSINPTGAIDLYDSKQVDEGKTSSGISPGAQATIWGVVLFAMLLPAIYMRTVLARQPKLRSEEE